MLGLFGANLDVVGFLGAAEALGVVGYQDAVEYPDVAECLGVAGCQDAAEYPNVVGVQGAAGNPDAVGHDLVLETASEHQLIHAAGVDPSNLASIAHVSQYYSY